MRRPHGGRDPGEEPREPGATSAVRRERERAWLLDAISLFSALLAPAAMLYRNVDSQYAGFVLLTMPVALWAGRYAAGLQRRSSTESWSIAMSATLKLRPASVDPDAISTVHHRSARRSTRTRHSAQPVRLYR